MAWVERRERANARGKMQVTYRVRWRERDGRARAKTFPRKVDADRFAATISADIVRDQYIDPDAGKISFEAYARKWIEAQTFEETTREAVELRLRLHAFPALGDRYLSEVQPSTIQGWLRTLTDLAPTYRKVVFANVATVFTAAVDDELIAKNPCKAASRYGAPRPIRASSCPGRTNGCCRCGTNSRRGTGSWSCWEPGSACVRARSSPSPPTTSTWSAAKSTSDVR